MRLTRRRKNDVMLSLGPQRLSWPFLGARRGCSCRYGDGKSSLDTPPGPQWTAAAAAATANRPFNPDSCSLTRGIQSAFCGGFQVSTSTLLTVGPCDRRDVFVRFFPNEPLLFKKADPEMMIHPRDLQVRVRANPCRYMDHSGDFQC